MGGCILINFENEWKDKDLDEPHYGSVVLDRSLESEVASSIETFLWQIRPPIFRNKWSQNIATKRKLFIVSQQANQDRQITRELEENQLPKIQWRSLDQTHLVKGFTDQFERNHVYRGSSRWLARQWMLDVQHQYQEIQKITTNEESKICFRYCGHKELCVCDWRLRRIWSIPLNNWEIRHSWRLVDRLFQSTSANDSTNCC